MPGNEVEPHRPAKKAPAKKAPAKKAPAKKAAAKKAPAKKAAAKKAPAKKAPAKKAAAKKAPAKKAPAKKAAAKKAPRGDARASGRAGATSARLTLPPAPDDPAAVLGLAVPFTRAQLQAAYRAFVRAHHPDRGGNAATFARGVRAYELLREGDG